MNKFVRYISLCIAVSFILFISSVIYLANMGGNNVLFDIVQFIPYGDKIGHFILFGLLAAIALFASKFSYLDIFLHHQRFYLNSKPNFKCVEPSVNKPIRIRIYYGIFVVSLFVLFEEISQIFITTRTFDMADLVADALGITLFSAVAISINNKPCIK